MGGLKLVVSVRLSYMKSLVVRPGTSNVIDFQGRRERDAWTKHNNIVESKTEYLREAFRKGLNGSVCKLTTNPTTVGQTA